jgi:hypothetical protein
LLEKAENARFNAGISLFFQKKEIPSFVDSAKYNAPKRAILPEKMLEIPIMLKTKNLEIRHGVGNQAAGNG